MPLSRRTRRLIAYPLIYLVFCSLVGVFVADGALHPQRNPLTPEDEAFMRKSAQKMKAQLDDASLIAPDGITLRAWSIHPDHGNGNAVIVLHGLADNRFGMNGYARMFLAHGYAVLMPDARAHGASGGDVASFGLLERNDIHPWFDFVAAHGHPHCIFGFAESMGAAQLLQSLADTHFCAVAAESSFANFREIAYDRMGQPWHLGPWFGRILLRPLIEAAFLRARWKYNLNMSQVSPEDAVAATTIPVFLIHGQIDSNIPVRHSRQIHARNPQQFSGKFRTPITAAPSAWLPMNSKRKCSPGSTRTPHLNQATDN